MVGIVGVIEDPVETVEEADLGPDREVVPMFRAPKAPNGASKEVDDVEDDDDKEGTFSVFEGVNAMDPGPSTVSGTSEVSDLIEALLSDIPSVDAGLLLELMPVGRGRALSCLASFGSPFSSSTPS